jgi:nucleotide-binding universal stress UspA family protein
MEHPLRTIVVGIGETETLDPHLEPALRLVARHDATLYVVHAYWIPDPLLYPYPEMSAFSPESTRAVQEAVLGRMEAQVRKLATDARVELRAVPVPADLAIIQVAEETNAELIVVGATRHGKLASTLLGTSAQRVVRAASVPVLVIRRPGTQALRRVLMTTDLSELSSAVYLRALDLVMAMRQEAEPELRMLLVVGHDLSSPPPMRQAVIDDLAHRDLGEFLRRLPPATPQALGKVRLGNAAHEIVAEAAEWDADLLVLGTHGRGGVSRFLIGSVAEAVLRRALCDILIIPASAVTRAGSASTPGA